MAIYHLSAKIIKRSAGRTATASAAYRAGEKITDERTGMVFDYTKKRYIGFSRVYAPSHSPAWATNRLHLWNEAEKIEARKDAQVAREIEVALPIELNEREQVLLLERFVQTELVSKGMVADVCIHNKPGNPHAHIMLTTRSISPAGFGQKCRDWNSTELLEQWREQWARRANYRLSIAGHKSRIDHRTLEAQGIDREPSPYVPSKKFGNPRMGRGKPIQPTHIKDKKMSDDILKAVGLSIPTPCTASNPDQPDSGLSPRMLWLMLRKPEYVFLFGNEELLDLLLAIDLISDKPEAPCLRLKTKQGTVYDYGNRVTAGQGTDQEIDLMIALAKAKGWKGVALNGSDDFKQRYFIRAVTSGAFTPEQIKGYEPSPEVLAQAIPPQPEHVEPASQETGFELKGIGNALDRMKQMRAQEHSKNKPTHRPTFK